jgi:hypothetical protein
MVLTRNPKRTARRRLRSRLPSPLAVVPLSDLRASMASEQGTVAACKHAVRSRRWEGPGKFGQTLCVFGNEKCG